MKKKISPVQLGEELAAFIIAQHKRAEPHLKTLCILGENGEVRDQCGLMLMELMWERDFWKSKVLGLDTPAAQ